MAVLRRVLAWIAVLGTLLATAFCGQIIADGNYCWSAFGFSMMALSWLAGLLFLGVLPSGIVYSRTKNRSELANLAMTLGSFCLVLFETALLWVLPQRGE